MLIGPFYYKQNFFFNLLLLITNIYFQERVSSIFTILKKLPKPNYDLVERLIFHLARVALGENHNR